MSAMPWRRKATLALILTLAGCQSQKLSIRRTRDGQELTAYRLRSLTGIRDGEKLFSEAVLADDTGTLTMQMRFQIGVPPRLETGKYVWQRKDSPQTQGSVRANAITFLGGQDEPPSLGGAFELISDDVSLYDVRIPPTRVQLPGKSSLPR
jgi:hypothetical protein